MSNLLLNSHPLIGNEMTKTPELTAVIAMVEQDLPGWGWLVRNLEEDGKPPYFANITSPDFEQFTDGESAGHSGDLNHAFGETPAQALLRSHVSAMLKVLVS